MDSVFLEVTDDLYPGLRSRWIPASQILSLGVGSYQDGWVVRVDVADKSLPASSLLNTEAEANAARLHLAELLQGTGTSSIRVVRWQGSDFAGVWQ
ncbi:hypothetical protein Achl_4402 (plasmid) [Pseudarthrobacter chlorophenolicus A6]|uniref:Uncharacterized protein n=1 Tax=Pseudarthrobacter chlorophenolicus (strain ATCC 700700 / DSM 12829 / CIP 107037 / JCM 12360 / KCTC 9906 / NCIMB 13794 / A6) TaxID=452863 RepID=B8HIV6_PSECP|nr:hypothetical protein Achl_4402 [Pseudarthrobacter chlorophenolicus A6]SDQ16918.1 hypothetical protein SAMN04489738_0459 [Pseudarthrobacter chlorophenolicus]